MVTKFIRSLQYINYTDHCISLAHEICGLINTNYKLQTQKPRLHWHFKTVSKWFQIGLGQLCECALETAFCKPPNGCGLVGLNVNRFETGLSASVNGLNSTPRLCMHEGE